MHLIICIQKDKIKLFDTSEYALCQLGRAMEIITRDLNVNGLALNNKT